MYLRMKLDIIRKRRLQKRFEELQTSKHRFLVSPNENFDDHIYQIAPSLIKPSPPPEFNPIELTNEWIINHNNNDNDNSTIISTQQQPNQI